MFTSENIEAFLSLVMNGLWPSEELLAQAEAEARERLARYSVH